MDRIQLLQHFDVLAETPDAVEKLRAFVLDLAVRGRLVPQANKPDKDLAWQKFCVELDERHHNSEPFALFEIPEGWRWAVLDEIAEPCGQKKPDVRFTYVDVSAIDKERGVISAELQVLEADEAPSRARKLVRKNSVIYSTVRPNLRNIAVIEKDFDPPAIVSTAFAVMYPEPFLSSRYLFLWLRSAPFQADVAAKMKGVAYPAISDSELWQCPIPIPPPEEQRRIVAKVEEFLALCDELEAAQTAAREHRTHLVRSALDHLITASTPEEFRRHAAFILQHSDLVLDSVSTLRQAILSLAVQGHVVPHENGDTKIREIKFEEIIEDSRYGTAKKCHHQTEGTPVLRIPNVVTGKIDLSNLKRTELTKKEKADLALQKGDLLVVRSNGSVSLVGRAAVVTEECEGSAFAGYLVRIRLRLAEANPEFIQLALSSSLIRQQIEKPIRTTSGVKNINTQEIYRLTFPLPPMPEQQRIVAKVDELMRWCDALESRLTAAQTTATQLLDATLHQILAA